MFIPMHLHAADRISGTFATKSHPSEIVPRENPVRLL
jgi:hypothetical protein